MTMSARFDYAKNTKTINEEDTLTSVKVAQAIADAESSALTHYEAERGGESDGAPIYVERADGTEEPLTPGEEWGASAAGDVSEGA